MSERIIELFGYDPHDSSPAATNARLNRTCPFIDLPCVKQLRNGERSGVCTLGPTRREPVICCPYRLYADNHQFLKDVAEAAFGPDLDLSNGRDACRQPAISGRSRVAVFGKSNGGELRLPNRSAGGGYYVDWILAKLNNDGSLAEFTAVEVQSIDTTGNYTEERLAHLAGNAFSGRTTAGLNWENVNKRILPQLIYKGNVLQRERKCSKGMFFVCPIGVYEKIMERLGGALLSYPPQAGGITFLAYDISTPIVFGTPRSLSKVRTFTTSIAQVAHAFISPTNLPPENVYESAINTALGN